MELQAIIGRHRSLEFHNFRFCSKKALFQMTQIFAAANQRLPQKNRPFAGIGTSAKETKDYIFMANDPEKTGVEGKIGVLTHRLNKKK